MSTIIRSTCIKFKPTYRLSSRYLCTNTAFNLDQRIYTLVKQNRSPNQIIQLFNENKDKSDYNAKTYVIVQKSLIKLQCQNKQCYDADNIWEHMKHKNTLTTKDYYEIILIFVSHRLPKTALKIFYKMVRDNIQQTEAIYVSVMACVAQLRSHNKLKDANKIYNIIANNNANFLETNSKIATSILSMFLKCGDMTSAQKIFQTKCDRKSVVTWCVLINGMIEDGKLTEAVQLFDEMLKNGILPDAVVYTTITKAIRRLKLLDKANDIYHIIDNDGNIIMYSNIPLCNALISMFGACGDVNKSNEIWNTLMDNKLDIPDNKTLQAIVFANYENGNYEMVIEAYETMKELRDGLPIGNRPGLQQRNLNPQKLTCIRTIEACGQLIDVEKGKFVHLDIMDSNSQLLRQDEVPYVLMEMYIKCCGLTEGIDMFKDVTRMHDVKTFTFMINTCIAYGENMKAFVLFDEMRNVYEIKPDSTVIVSILKICDQAILLKHMYEYINSIDSTVCDDAVVCEALKQAYGRCKDTQNTKCMEMC